MQKSQKGIPSTLPIENVDKDFWKWVRVDQAGWPLPPKILSILVGLTLKLVSLCSIISILEKIWTVCFISEYICVSSLEIYVWQMLAKMGRFNRKFSRNIARNGWSLQSVSWILAEFYFNRGLQRLYTGTCIILQKKNN